MADSMNMLEDFSLKPVMVQCPIEATDILDVDRTEHNIFFGGSTE